MKISLVPCSVEGETQTTSARLGRFGACPGRRRGRAGSLSASANATSSPAVLRSAYGAITRSTSARDLDAEVAGGLDDLAGDPGFDFAVEDTRATRPGSGAGGRVRHRSASLGVVGRFAEAAPNSAGANSAIAGVPSPPRRISPVGAGQSRSVDSDGVGVGPGAASSSLRASSRLSDRVVSSAAVRIRPGSRSECVTVEHMFDSIINPDISEPCLPLSTREFWHCLCSGARLETCSLQGHPTDTRRCLKALQATRIIGPCSGSRANTTAFAIGPRRLTAANIQSHLHVGRKHCDQQSGTREPSTGASLGMKQSGSTDQFGGTGCVDQLATPWQRTRHDPLVGSRAGEVEHPTDGEDRSQADQVTRRSRPHDRSYTNRPSM